MTSKHIFIVAGEASGDAHAGRMIAELKTINPSIKVTGVGGDTLRKAGAEIIIDFSELAVMGLVEVLKRYCHIKKIFNQVVKYLKNTPPDLLILVDYPGFNLKLAKVAKSLGIPVMYYISPKVWAWRSGRIKTIQRVVDHMAVLFPFEQEMYGQAGVESTCVGHPLVDAVKTDYSCEQAKQQLGLNQNHKVVGLFPGSRRSEVAMLLPIMLDAAKHLSVQDRDLQIVLPLAPGLERSYLNQFLTDSDLDVTIMDKDFYDLTKACDAVVAASGTVTLEVALLGVPHFIVYRVAPLTYRILKRLVKIPYVGLCNIVTAKPVILELLQDEVTVERVSQELHQRLYESDSKHLADQVRQQVLSALGPSGGARNAAQQIITLLGRTE